MTYLSMCGIALYKSVNTAPQLGDSQIPDVFDQRPRLVSMRDVICGTAMEISHIIDVVCELGLSCEISLGLTHVR